MTASVRAEAALDRDIEDTWRLQQDDDEEDWDDEDWDEDEEEEDVDWDGDDDDDYGKRPRRHPDEWH